MSFKYHLITNTGTLAGSIYAQAYPNTLCLSQLYEKDEQYRELLKQKIRKGHRVILDNGTHEGFDVDLDSYLAVVKDLMPTVAVLTDLVGRHHLISRKQSLRFVERVFASGILLKLKFMYAAQGENEQQVLTDYEWALANLDPERFIIGLGQGYLCWAKDPSQVDRESTRIPMIEEVMKMRWADRHEFHVLGARWSADHSHYERFPRITGIDTIKPCTCAFAGIVYPNRPTFRSVPRMCTDCVDEDLLGQNVAAFCAEYGCEG